MASKYAHLPDLAVDQPDVFESNPDRRPDVVDGTSATKEIESSTAEIERGNIDAKSAFDRFRTSKPAAVDQFVAVSNSGNDETTEEMLLRLTRETATLAHRLERKKAGSQSFTGASDGESASAVEMAEGLRRLETRLQQLSKESETLSGRPQVVDNNAVAAQLLGRLQRFKDASLHGESGEHAVVEDTVQYELTYTPDRSKFNQETRTLRLEGRLAKLERLVGIAMQDDTSRIVPLPTGPLAHEVDTLSEQVKALTTEGAAVAERRLLAAVAQAEKHLAARSQTQLSGEILGKVEELYIMMQRWDSTASSIPLVVDRLVALRKVHDGAARVTGALESVEAVEADVQATLSNQKNVLKELSSNLEDNVKQTLANFEALSKRLSAVEVALKS